MPAGLLDLNVRDAIAYLTLNRPDVRNAFNADLIAELHRSFDQLSGDTAVRAVVLTGAGKVFCGGADINWMRASLELSHDENVADAQRMSDMFRAIDRCSKPVIGRIFGAALGGGAGLVATCDIAIASEETVFGFTETKLGILPAVISPFVLARIGASHARALFLTGERFDCNRALRIGLVHYRVAVDALDSEVERVVTELRSASSTAIAAAKATVAAVREASYDASRDITASAIAAQRTSEEGQEGLRAFLERRKARWAP